MDVLNIKNISKSIGKKNILIDVNLTVKEGEICGLLGPNGAGKTTIIKIITGFLTPDTGEIYVCDNDIKKDRKKYISNIAAIIETPRFYPYLNGFDNLKQLARLDDNINEDDIIESIKLAGLKNRMYDKIKKYSLGMKQRLGLAQVMMGKQKLWLLDEPTNGLDASGIIEFRKILKDTVKKRNVSILISSHILSEIELLCDKIVFINNGEIVESEKMKDIENNNNFDVFEIIINKADNYRYIFDKLNFVKKIAINEKSIVVHTDKNCYYKLVKSLIDNNVVFDNIINKNKTLEERYMEVIESDKINSDYKK